MGPSNTPALVIFPGALGDFICFLPTLQALQARHGALTVVANPSLLELIRLPHASLISIHRREVADLYASAAPLSETTGALLMGHAFAYSWSGCGDTNFAARLAMASDAEVRVYPFRAMRPREHAVEYYARCAALAPSAIDRGLIHCDDQWASSFLKPYSAQRLLVLHPGSGSLAKNWLGFTELSRRWLELREDVVIVLQGPAERERQTPLPAGVLVADASLPRLAALLSRAHLYVGNDSGVSHLAGLCATRGLVLFGASDPITWAPRAPTMKVIRGAPHCQNCDVTTFCTHRLPVEDVMRELRYR